MLHDAEFHSLGAMLGAAVRADDLPGDTIMGERPRHGGTDQTDADDGNAVEQGGGSIAHDLRAPDAGGLQNAPL